MKNVVSYIRVSTEGQVGEDKFGIDAQRAQIAEYCRKNDMRLVHEYKDEAKSGAKMDRPEFDRIVYGDVQNPPIEAVIVAKSDRIARDINVYYYYKMQLKMKGIELISIAEDFGQFGVFANMLEAFTLCVAEMERENIMKRTSAGRIQKAEQGGYAGGRAPVGYRVSDGRLIPNPDEAKAVRRIFSLQSEGMALRDIADKLGEEGYRSRSGAPYTFGTVRNILNNKKTYQGYYRYGKNSEWVEGQQEAILPRD